MIKVLCCEHAKPSITTGKKKKFYYRIIGMGLHVRPVARLIKRGVHINYMRASGHTTYNLMRFKLSMLVLKYLHHTKLVGGQ